MTEREACGRISDLRMAKTIYQTFLNDETSVFFGDATIRIMLRKTDTEIERIEELIFNGELIDSLQNYWGQNEH